MNTVRFIADLHFGHKNICKYTGELRGDCKTVEEHDEWIINQWNSIVGKSDLTWILGDVSFSRNGIQKVKRLNGSKHLIFGNHDSFALNYYMDVFNKVHGFKKYKGFWLSHAPILGTRGLKNIHGHTHSETLVSGDHVCVSVEAINGKPISLQEIIDLTDS